MDNDGMIDFPEFVVGLWNYCAADQPIIQKMAFYMADVMDRGKLSVDDVRQLFVLVLGKGPDKKSAKKLNHMVHKALKQLDPKKTGFVTLAAWQSTPKVGRGPRLMTAALGGGRLEQCSLHCTPQAFAWACFFESLQAMTAVFKPAMELQAQLVKAYFGKGFWTKATKTSQR